MKYNNKGFTLIELLVVIAIIGLLSSIVLANVNLARNKAINIGAVQTIKQYQNAITAYANDFGYYPQPTGSFASIYCLGDSSTQCIYSSGNKVYDPNINAALAPYMSSFPQPNTGTITSGGSTYKGATYGCSLSGGSPLRCLRAYIDFPVNGTSCTIGTTYSDGVTSVCDYVFLRLPVPP
jgi:prepilin-type N-terminal cleavage/methylation domain-containing protein